MYSISVKIQKAIIYPQFRLTDAVNSVSSTWDVTSLCILSDL